MKDPKLGDYLLWRDQPAIIVAETDQKVVTIEVLENHSCPECKADLGKKQIHMVVASPLFQENAKSLPTISN